MIGLLQRVSHASVEVHGIVVGHIGAGLLVLVGVQAGDTEQNADRLVHRVTRYRVFPDGRDRMNLSLRDTGGGLLLVPQFTLAADTSRGLRASFSGAAAPEHAESLFRRVVSTARDLLGDRVSTGTFGADMQVQLTNDGPVTFWLEVPPSS
jgi:D-tyrosyl-tRNA(Tyr) deacylase